MRSDDKRAGDPRAQGSRRPGLSAHARQDLRLPRRRGRRAGGRRRRRRRRRDPGRGLAAPGRPRAAARHRRVGAGAGHAGRGLRRPARVAGRRGARSRARSRSSTATSRPRPARRSPPARTSRRSTCAPSRRRDGAEFARFARPFAHATWLFDTARADGRSGGTGRTFDWPLARRLAGERRIVVSGGLTPENVGDCVRAVRPFAVDVASGVETNGTKDPRKIARLRAPPSAPPTPRQTAVDRPLARQRDPPTPPDARGYFGRFGGVFVPEVLVEALAQLEAATREAFADPAFWAEYEGLLRDFVGRPSPIYVAERLVDGPHAPIVFKREDTNHTGAHKINNTVGQALLARRMGKSRIIAETGAGQHGVATATIGAKLGHAGRRLHGRGRRRAASAQRLRDEAARRDRAPGRERHAHAQGRDQRSLPRVGGAGRGHVLRHRLGGRRAPVSVPGARVPEGDRGRGARAGAGALRPAAERRRGLRRRRLQRDGHLRRLRRPTPR